LGAAFLKRVRVRLHRKSMATMTSATNTSQKFATRALGNSDLQLTPIGYGAWAIGGGNWEFGWGAQDERESIAAIDAPWTVD
jgi:hypothetical protein